MGSFSRKNYFYDLPSDLLAAEPLAARETARLLVVRRRERTLEHYTVADLPRLLNSSFVMVANNTKVFRARLLGRRVMKKSGEGGGKVEFFMLRQESPLIWRGLMKTGATIAPGFEFTVGEIHARVLKREETNAGAIVTAEFSDDPIQLGLGEVPLPPYIVAKRTEGAAKQTEGGTQPTEKGLLLNVDELEIYNTVYARESGSVASPTAGRHFTRALIQELEALGISWNEITLHVGLGTFKPVMVDDIRQHKMHAEAATISLEVADRLNQAKCAGKKILAVGTTSARTLESFYEPVTQNLGHGTRETEIFIYPESGHHWSSVDALLTNFHFPESTLLMMVASFLGDTTWTLQIYEEAVRMRYRFYSYGDAMLIL